MLEKEPFQIKIKGEYLFERGDGELTLYKFPSIALTVFRSLRVLSSIIEQGLWFKRPVTGVWSHFIC